LNDIVNIDVVDVNRYWCNWTWWEVNRHICFSAVWHIPQRSKPWAVTPRQC